MASSKKKVVKLNEVSLESSQKEELPMVELSRNENKLFDEDDDIGTPTVPELSIAS